MYRFPDDYPLSISEVLARPVNFKAATLKVTRRFRQSKPWRGTLHARGEKLVGLVRELSGVYGIEPPHVNLDGLSDGDSGGSFYMPALNAMYLRGRPSVVTCLHEFAHALGKGEFEACRWSLWLFRKVFPESFARLNFVGHMARAAGMGLRPADSGEDSVGSC